VACATGTFWYSSESRNVAALGDLDPKGLVARFFLIVGVELAA